MQFRALRRGEFNHELIWLLVSVATAAAVLVLLQSGVPTPRCLFHEITGLPCLTCGATRCLLKIAHGEFAAAVYLNPLAFAAFLAIGVFDLYAVAVLLFRMPRIRANPLSMRTGDLCRIAAVLLCGANWIYLLLFLP